MAYSFVSFVVASSLLGCGATDPGTVMTIPGSDVAGGSLNATLPLLFRVSFMKNYGASYVCVSEIQFFNKMLETLKATFRNQSSCYGCATKCQDCTAKYGDPTAQFNGVASTPDGVNAVDDSMWSCTAPGTFSDGVGSESVVFELPERPARMTLRRAAVGDYASKDFALQELDRPSGVWGTLSQVEDAVNGPIQSVDILVAGDVEDASPFPYGFRQCGDAEREVPDAISTTDKQAVSLDVSHTPAALRKLTNNGHGVQVDGSFGTATIDTFVYDATQLNFRFPSTHSIDRPDHPANGEKAVGEMDILYQSRFVIGQPKRLLVFTVLLVLPLEGSDTTVEEDFFKVLGMETVPEVGVPRPITSIVDLGAFSKQFANAAIMPCTDTQRWIVALDYAHVSGSVVAAMKNFGDIPFDLAGLGVLPSDPVADITSNEPEDNSALGSMDWNGQVDGWVPQSVEMSKRQLAIAYATGDWKNVFEEPTPAPTPAPTYEPIYMTLTLDRVDYNQLTDDASRVEEFQGIVRKDIADHFKITSSYVQLKLEKVSTFITNVAVTVFPKEEAMPVEDGPIEHLGKTIRESVAGMNSLLPISSGDITVEGPTVSRYADSLTSE